MLLSLFCDRCGCTFFLQSLPDLFLQHLELTYSEGRSLDNSEIEGLRCALANENCTFTVSELFPRFFRIPVLGTVT